MINEHGLAGQLTDFTDAYPGMLDLTLSVPWMQIYREFALHVSSFFVLIPPKNRTNTIVFTGV